MTHVIHHVPGRLRVKTPSVKRNAANAESARALLAARPGILSSKVSVVTGSVVVTYDADAIAPDQILGLLKQNGLLPAEGGKDLLAGVRISVPKSAIDHISGRIVELLVEKALERSALALIGALL